MGIKDEKALIFGSKNNNVVSSGGVAGSGGGSLIGHTTIHSSSSVGDGKIYTQVSSSGADMKPTSNVFNLNFSFRYQSRKAGNAGGASGCAGIGVQAVALQDTTIGPSSGSHCNNTDEMLQIVHTTSSSNGKEIKFLNNPDRTKYLTPTASVVGDSATYTRISGNSTRARPETEIACKKTKESNNEIQQQTNEKQHQQQPTYATSSSSLMQQQQQHCYGKSFQFVSVFFQLNRTIFISDVQTCAHTINTLI